MSTTAPVNSDYLYVSRDACSTNHDRIFWRVIQQFSVPRAISSANTHLQHTHQDCRLRTLCNWTMTTSVRWCSLYHQWEAECCCPSRTARHLTNQQRHWFHCHWLRPMADSQSVGAPVSDMSHTFLNPVVIF